MNEPFLVCDGVSKHFAAVAALNHVSLSVGADELLVVLGPTGAGKTTLLRTIAGLERPNEGRIRMAGQDVLHLAPAARDVALVFQNFSLYPDWSVRRNLEFPLRAPGRNLSNKHIQERVAWVADMLRIGEHLDRPAHRLSGGQMQRVAIGRAIVRRPRLFIMDEPLTNLDAKLRESLRVELVRLRRELKTPMIYVTHDQAEALSMGDRIAVLAKGRILQIGSPADMYRHPISSVVARQLGQPAINIFRTTMQNGQWVTATGLALGAIPVGHEHTDGAQLIGIRPEHIQLHGGQQAATVRLIEDMGPTLVALVDWCGEPAHLLVAKPSPLKPGDRIMPLIDMRHRLLFSDD